MAALSALSASGAQRQPHQVIATSARPGAPFVDEGHTGAAGIPGKEGLQRHGPDGTDGGGELAGWTVNFLSNSQQELFGKQGGGEQAASLRQGVSLPTNLAVTGGGRSASARLSSRRSLSRAAGCPGHDSRVSQQHGEWASRPHCPWDANGRAACLMSLASHGPWRPESATP